MKKPELLGRDVRICLEMGREVSKAAYAKGLEFREAFREEMGSLLGAWDVLIIPSAPGPAPRKGTRKLSIKGRTHNVALPLTLLNYPASFSGFPALSAPWREDGRLPVGFQLIARDEEKLLAFALSKLQ